MITGFRFETAQDVDAMWEADAAAEWERINEEDDMSDKLDDAAYELGQAWDALCDVIAKMANAADAVDGTPAYDRVVSLMNQIEDIQDDVNSLQYRFKEGDC